MKEKSFERKKEVLEAALDEFTINNYEQASLNRIIKTSKISKGTFYYHFENKENLYLYLLKDGVKLKWEYISKVTSGNTIDFTALDIFDKFLYQAKIGLEFAEKFPKYNDLARMFSKESGQPIYDIALKHLNQDGQDVLRPMVEDSIKNGELNENFDIEFILKTMTYLFSNFEDIIEKGETLNDTLTRLEEFIEFMKYGFKNQNS